MRKIDTVIIHCAATPNFKEFDVTDIRQWHVEGNGWSDVGYHYIIRVDGEIEVGRQEQVSGAHCRGYNARSIGICMVGNDRFTDEQWLSLKKLVRSLKVRYDLKEITGHYKYSDKTCPNFDVEEWVDAMYGRG